MGNEERGGKRREAMLLVELHPLRLDGRRRAARSVRGPFLPQSRKPLHVLPESPSSQSLPSAKPFALSAKALKSSSSFST
eukprot:9163927-Pyramimonas_sp.AAC.1